jgi:hypothetical protein
MMHNCISNCQLNISTQMSNRHLKSNVSKTELINLLCQSFLSQLIVIMIPLDPPKHVESFFLSSLSLPPHSGSTGGWTEGLTHARQALYHFSHPSPFCVGYFLDRVLLYAQAGLDHDPAICASLCSWGWQAYATVPSHGWDGVSWTFCLGWPQTIILLISASWVARIIGVSQWCLASILSLSELQMDWLIKLLIVDKNSLPDHLDI